MGYYLQGTRTHGKTKFFSNFVHEGKRGLYNDIIFNNSSNITIATSYYLFLSHKEIEMV